MGSDYWWLFLGIGASGLLIAAWNVFGAPALRRWRMRRPVRAHFTNRDSKRTYSGRDVSKGDPHLIRRLTLPAAQEILIEIGYRTRIAFYLKELVVSIDGDFSARPRIVERTDQYIQSGSKPSTERDYIAGDAYHAFYDVDRNVGTHFVLGLKLKTKKAGLFPVRLEFVTDEIEGRFDGLEILVEDNPITKMHCHQLNHGQNCLVSPFDLPPIPQAGQ